MELAMLPADQIRDENILERALHPGNTSGQLSALTEVSPDNEKHLQRVAAERALSDASSAFLQAAGLDPKDFIGMDVMTLLHEAGHCFHSFAAHRQPLLWQRHPGAEAAELASMSMELLAMPYLADPGGFVSPDEAARAETAHLEDILVTLAHIASVDAFQAWLYTAGEGATADQREGGWLDIRRRFETGVDWTGFERERATRWYRQLHIFIYPFYYIEYGIAQLGALQVWRNARRDPEGAVAAYRRFLALGATRPLPELYRAAGVELSLDAGLLGELVAMVEEEMDTLRGSLAGVA